MRPLGKNQKYWLWTIATHPRGKWFPHCGFYWGSFGQSEKMCESLVRRGLLRKVDDRPTYEITPEGREAAK